MECRVRPAVRVSQEREDHQDGLDLLVNLENKDSPGPREKLADKDPKERLDYEDPLDLKD